MSKFACFQLKRQDRNRAQCALPRAPTPRSPGPHHAPVHTSRASVESRKGRLLRARESASEDVVRVCHHPVTSRRRAADPPRVAAGSAVPQSLTNAQSAARKRTRRDARAGEVSL